VKLIKEGVGEGTLTKKCDAAHDSGRCRMKLPPGGLRPKGLEERGAGGTRGGN